MPTVLIRDPLSPEELISLRTHFPQFIYRMEIPDQELSSDEWSQVEIIYGTHLKHEEFNQAARLRWIHVPDPSMSTSPLQHIQQTHVMVTVSKHTETHQVAEYAVGAILAFAKNLFDWKGEGSLLPTGHLRDLIWSLRSRTHLQIGLGGMGESITAKLRDFGMRIWGVSTPPSFHANCHKIFSIHELNTLLPAADIVCVSMRVGNSIEPILKKAQLELMKQDSILLVLGAAGLVDHTALFDLAKDGKFRGVVWDGSMRSTEAKQLRSLPQVLMTPHIAELPTTEERLGYRLFVHNLRRFIHQDFNGMRGLIERSILPAEEDRE